MTNLPALKTRALEIHQTLLAAFGEPIWRNPLPAIDELVSTILSQNTNDVIRDKAFDALRAKIPSWEGVRDAPVEDVMDAISPAGLANQKGPRIQQVLHSKSTTQGFSPIKVWRLTSPDNRFPAGIACLGIRAGLKLHICCKIGLWGQCRAGANCQVQDKTGCQDQDGYRWQMALNLGPVGCFANGEKVDPGTDIIETDSRPCQVILMHLVFFHVFVSRFLDRVV